MTKEKSVYQTLSSVNVEKEVKGKNGFRYLSWSSAVARLLEHYPHATWKHREWDNQPYFKTEGGCFVEVSVTIDDITRSQLHPILDFRNKPVLKPDAFQINTSLQRALAKAISLHGLGLYIYQGEDLPQSEKEALDDARSELVGLLKDAGKFNGQTVVHINKMNYEQLREKINEYRK